MAKRFISPLPSALPSKEMVEKCPGEYDFRDLKAHERAMAVAWEYSREVREKVFPPDKVEWKNAETGEVKITKTQGVSYVPRSQYLDPSLLTFAKSPCWPDTPFKKLTYAQKRHAFPNAYWPKPSSKESNEWKLSTLNQPENQIMFTMPVRNKAKMAALIRAAMPPPVQDVTPGKTDSQGGWQAMIVGLGGAQKLHHQQRLFLVDLEHDQSEIISSFESFIKKALSAPTRGRSSFERDLTALALWRLYRTRGGKLRNVYSGPKDTNIPTQAKAKEYLCYAKARLGLKKNKRVAPIFSWTCPPPF